MLAAGVEPSNLIGQALLLNEWQQGDEGTQSVIIAGGTFAKAPIPSPKCAANSMPGCPSFSKM
jgi:hypothetical protein